MPARHRSLVLATPWPGVHGTLLDSERHFTRHAHATFGIGLLQQGAQRSASGRGPVEAVQGELITSNPGEVHDGRPHGGASRRWRMLHLEPACVHALAPQDGSRLPEIARPVVRDEALRRLLLALFAQLDAWRRTPDAALALACEEGLVRMGTQLLARHGTLALPPVVDADVARMRERLADEAASPPSLAALAAMTGLSRYQALRRFQQAYGLPPHAWLMQQRVERARQHIRAGLSLAAAAAAAGFADQSHLSRQFMQAHGFTPGAWRRAVAPQ
jgi:AraC-like DNA-binding protein